jgi:hypothetical protein
MSSLFPSLVCYLKDLLSAVNQANFIRYSGKEMNVSNNIYKSHPLVFHASGPFAKLQLRALADYIPKAWNKDGGCITCWDDMISLSQKKVLTLKQKVVSFTLQLIFFID